MGEGSYQGNELRRSGKQKMPEREIPFKKELEKLELLISQGQFELLIPREMPGEIRLVYLMNDAVESFLVFQGASLTGTYQPDFQGELTADLEQEEERYLLIVHQGEEVCTLFFRELVLETHLFDYGKTGHFWVKGYEYLRQLEYRIAILRDKKEYLGEEFCTEEERRLSALAEFPPLNFCCYPAVSEAYLVPSCDWWQVSEKALAVMEELAEEAGDPALIRWLHLYGKFPWKGIARKIASMLHTVQHGKTVDLLTQKLAETTAVYQERSFGKQTQELLKKARHRKKELEEMGKKVELLKEEPFLYAKDSVEYKLHLMIWKEEGRDRKVEIETIEE